MIVRVACHLALLKQLDPTVDLVEEVQQMKRKYLLQWIGVFNEGNWKTFSEFWEECFFSETTNLSSKYTEFRDQNPNYKNER
jgi:hypothetical protein